MKRTLSTLVAAGLLGGTAAAVTAPSASASVQYGPFASAEKCAVARKLTAQKLGRTPTGCIKVSPKASSPYWIFFA